MAGGFLDRMRAATAMQAARLDAIVLCAPWAIRYATGAEPGVATLFGRAGAAFALVPADPALTTAAVVGDTQEAAFRAASGIADVRTHPVWIETATLTGASQADGSDVAARIDAGWTSRPSGFARPATFDFTRAAAALRDQLAERGLARGRIGVDLAFVPAADFAPLRAALHPAEIEDASPLLDRLAAIKHPDEVARLRRGAALGVSGLQAMADAVREGDGPAEISRAFRAGVARAAGGTGPATWEYVAIGPRPWGPAGRVERGAVIKADVGCVIDGYSSDTSRDFVWREPSPQAARLHALIEQAFAAGFAALQPGASLAHVHARTTEVLRQGGLRRFSRGHFGHGLGAGPFSEAWPFIAADSDALAEPGMVLAFEVPLYVDGLGGFNLEDQVLVTESGLEVMSPAPRGLRILGC